MRSMKPLNASVSWKSKLRGMGGAYRQLFVVGVLAYLLGVLTSPAIPLLRTMKSNGVYLHTPQQVAPPDAQFQPRSSIEQALPEIPPVHQPLEERTDDCKQQQQQPPPLRGHQMLPTDLITFHTGCKKQGVAPDDARHFLITELFDGVSPFQNFPSPGVASLLQPERVSGWGSERTVFRRLMEEVRPRVVIELGSFLGASATHMGAIAQELGLSTEIFCFDDFRGWPGFRSGPFADIREQNGNAMLLNQFLQNVIHRNMSERILPLPFGTVASLSSFCKWGIYADLIEVDASHDFHSAWADINIAFRLLRPGGIMFGHDYFTAADRRGVRRAVDLFAKLNKLRVEPDGQHWIYRSLN